MCILFAALHAAVLAQWIPHTTGSTVSLRGLSAVDSHAAWVGGTQGTLLRTIDGGATWKSVAPEGAALLDFRDIEAFDRETAYALSAGAGGASRLYFTQDGGSHWRLLVENPDPKGFWDAIAFWDRRRGLLLGDPSDGAIHLRITADGGKTWTSPDTLPPPRPGESSFAASGTCLITASGGRAWFVTGGIGGGRIFASSDWGRTWRVSETPVRHENASSGIFSVAFKGQAGVVVGGDYQKTAEASGHTAFSRDGGKTWRLAAGSGRFLSAALFGRKLIIATGPSGTEISRDQGSKWSVASSEGYHALSMGRDGSIWASGAQGRVARLRLR